MVVDAHAHLGGSSISSSNVTVAQLLGSERVMMGTDLPNNVQTELAKCRSIDIPEEDRETSLGVTVRKVSNLGLQS